MKKTEKTNKSAADEIAELRAEAAKICEELDRIKDSITRAAYPGRRRKDGELACEMEFSDDDVIITDPSYVIQGDRAWAAFVGTVPFGDGPTIRKSGRLRILVANTLYGDWMCRMGGKLRGARHDFGTFTADTGLVCACAVGKRRMQRMRIWLPTQCYVLLEGFTGTVRIVHRKGRCHVEGYGRTRDGKISFRSSQCG